MRSAVLIAGALSVCALTAHAGEVTSFSAGIRAFNGDITQNGLTGERSQEEDTLFAHGSYTTGPFTIFGGVETFDVETAMGALSMGNELRFGELGLEYTPGAFGIGGQLADIGYETGVGGSRFASLYGIYRLTDLETGGGLFTLDVDGGDRDTGAFGFASYETSFGLSLGGQLSVSDAYDQIQAYGDYSQDHWDLSLDLIAQNDSLDMWFVALSGRVHITGPVSALASVTHLEMAGTPFVSEIALGGAYGFDSGAALEARYVTRDYSGGLKSDSIEIALVYALGAKRKPGYQPFGQTAAQALTPFFSAIGPVLGATSSLLLSSPTSSSSTIAP